MQQAKFDRNEITERIEWLEQGGNIAQAIANKKLNTV